MIDEFQKDKLRKLRCGSPNAYEEASIYTILLDLCEGNGIEDVVNVLEDVINDLSSSTDLKISKLFKYAKRTHK